MLVIFIFQYRTVSTVHLTMTLPGLDTWSGAFLQLQSFSHIHPQQTDLIYFLSVLGENRSFSHILTSIVVVYSPYMAVPHFILLKSVCL